MRLLVIPGSARAGSLNRRLAMAAMSMARDAGAVADELGLRERHLPLYDGDIEATSGVREGAVQCAEAIAAADARLVVPLEFNGFPTPLVINAIDWLSRVTAQGTRPAGLAASAIKPVALLSASTGPLGELHAMNHLRQYLQMAFAIVVAPRQFALGSAHEAFDENGKLRDQKARHAVGGVVTARGALAKALHAQRKAPLA